MIKISQVIEQLEKLRAEHGDLRVTKYGFRADVSDVQLPEIGFVQVNNKRENKPMYWSSTRKKGDRFYREKGEKVVQI